MTTVTPSGDFKWRVTFERPANRTDSNGEITSEPWTAVVKVAAVKKELSGHELLRTKQVQDDTTHRFVIRYRTDVTPTWRVTWDDPRGHHTAQITGIVETIPLRELEISATESRG